MTEAMAFHIVRAVQARDFHTVATALKGGEDPNCRYAGMRPLHTAVEAEDPEMAAFLMHWGASAEGVLNQNQQTAIALAKAEAEAEAKGGKAKGGAAEAVLRVLSDEGERGKVLAVLQERLEAEEAALAAKKRANLPRQVIFIFVLFMATVLALHALVLFSPRTAERVIPPKMLNDIYTLSPVLVHPDQRAYQEALRQQQAGRHVEL